MTDFDAADKRLGELAAALAKAQGEMEGAKRDKENPFFKSRYADLAACWDAIRAPLSKHGLALTQTSIVREDGLILLETNLIHSSGAKISGFLPVKPVKDDPQGMGSALTYARRYGLMAIVGLAPEDDDGNAASQPPEKPKRSKPKPAPEPAKLSAARELLQTLEVLAPGDTKKQDSILAEHSFRVSDKSFFSTASEVVMEKGQKRRRFLDNNGNPVPDPWVAQTLENVKRIPEPGQDPDDIFGGDAA